MLISHILAALLGSIVGFSIATIVYANSSDIR